MKNKKRMTEKARIDLVGELSDSHRDLINSGTTDPVEFCAIAVRYMHAGMPLRAGQIMREAWEMDDRKSVPKAVIIDSVVDNSGYGGTNETPVFQNFGVRRPVGAGGSVMAARANGDLYLTGSADPA